MKMTRHALVRWGQRCPGLDPDMEWYGARRASKKVRARIRSSCPEHAEYGTTAFRGYYYRVSRSGVVFVVAPPETIVTVFRLERNHVECKEATEEYACASQARTL